MVRQLLPPLLAPLLFIIEGCGTGAPATGTRYGAWVTPSRIATINGIAIGPINSGMLTDSSQRPVLQSINGISVELIGAGILVPLAPYSPSGRDKVMEAMRMADSSDTTQALEYQDWSSPTVNGLALSLTGTLGLGTVNGIAPSPLSGYTHRVNGIAASLMVQFVDELNGLGVGGLVIDAYTLNGLQLAVYINATHRTNGVQIAATNSSDHLCGLQLGLVNIAHTTRGAQIGVYNWGGDMRGVQIGGVNRVGPGFKGVQLGLLNIGPPGIWPLLSVAL